MTLPRMYVPSSTYALFASAAYHGQVVEETYVPSGTRLQIGNSPALAVPVPEGFPYIARITWPAQDAALVVDGRGVQYTLTPDADLSIEIGPVSLSLSLVSQYPLKRTSGLSWRTSVVFLTMFLMFATVFQEYDIAYEHRCEWFYPILPLQECEGGGVASGDAGVIVTAEYLARLLREDYAGDDEGYIVTEVDRPATEKERDDFYLPAGAEGPITNMGGARETDVEPVRVPEPEEEATPAEPEEALDVAPLYAEDVGTEVEALEIEATPEDTVAARDALDPNDVDADEAVAEAPAEEEEGWGIQDWYDAADARFEELQIDIMLRSARQRLAIDPNDPDALATLSYYQYLAMDYDGAERTYDTYIANYPEDPAGYNNKALIYKRTEQYEHEELLYRVALALEPLDTTAMNNLAVNLAHQGRFDEALAIMEQVEELDPGDPYANLHRSKIYAEMGRDSDALELLDQALKGMEELDTLHHIEFRQDIRVDPSFGKLRKTHEFRTILVSYYGEDTPLRD